MHNLGTVFQFEVLRTLRKKSFWILAFGFPLLFGAIIAVVYFSNKTTEQAALDTKSQEFSIAVTDESGLVSPDMLSALGAQQVADQQTGIDLVVDGSVDAYFYYPKDLTTSKVEVYGQNVGVFDNSRYQSVASALLTESVALTVDPQTTAVLRSQVGYEATTYRDGEAYNPLDQMIVPGIFLILFYLLIALFGNQMLTSTVEEKENRVIEMLLTTIKARTLIVGKILSLVSLAALQIVIILTPILTMYFLLGDKLSLPNIDLSNIAFDAARVAVAALLFLFSFLLFTGLLVTIGSASPTAKEAGGFLGMVMILIFGPLYAAPLFVSMPDSVIVKVLSLFPFTAPIPLLLRNAVGNLGYSEAAAGILILITASIAMLFVAVRVFRFGALQYSRRLTLKEIFRSRN